MPLAATEKIRNINSKWRIEEECGWRIRIKPLTWWREDRPDSSTREGRMRKEGEKRGRKRAHAR
jgi:hypothetical protein